MNGPRKRVLVVDDADYIREAIRQRFRAYNADAANAEYTFEVLVARQIEQAIEEIRDRRAPNQVDVIVLDLSFIPGDAEDRGGLRLAAALGLLRRLQQDIPLAIVFSSYLKIPDCVAAMLCGVWNVIDKGETTDKITAYDRVVESAVAGLHALETGKRLSVTATEWLHRNMTELRQLYGGQVIAIWHDPEPHVAASGKDVFDLQSRLESWRRHRPQWHDPFVLEIPPMPAAPKGLDVPR